MHFFASKLAYITQKHYFCVKNILTQLWNTNLVLAVVLHLFASMRIPLSANVQAWNSLLLLVLIWLRNTPTNASAASASSN
jgi:hypothetical protein